MDLPFSGPNSTLWAVGVRLGKYQLVSDVSWCCTWYGMGGGGRRGKVGLLIVANDQSLLDIGSVNIVHQHITHVSDAAAAAK